jgi:hypothetical protein
MNIFRVEEYNKRENNMKLAAGKSSLSIRFKLVSFLAQP